MNTLARMALATILGFGFAACSQATGDEAQSSEAELRGGKHATDGGVEGDKGGKKDKADKSNKGKHLGQAGEHGGNGGGKDRDGGVDEETETDEGAAGMGSKGGKSAEHKPAK